MESITYKYYEVRREIYNRHSDKLRKRNRSLKQIIKLFKPRFWVMFGLLVCSFVAAVLLSFFVPEKPFYFILVSSVFFISIFLEFSCEKIYNKEERSRELIEAKEGYEQYVRELKSTLTDCGIDSASKRKALKAECQSRLDKQAKPYNTVSTNAYNILIGVPIGAIVSAIMYKNSDDAALTQIVGLIMFGLLIIALSQVLRILTYYSDGHFKDQYLLEVLNEIEYAGE